MGIVTHNCLIGSTNSFVDKKRKITTTPISFSADKNSQKRTLKSLVGTGSGTFTRPSGRFSNYYMHIFSVSKPITTAYRW